MDDMYKAYVAEREGGEVIVVDGGFMILKDANNMLYLQDMFVVAHRRRQGLGQAMLDAACRIAQQRGYDSILTSCAPNARGSTNSIKAILASGFELCGSDANLVWFKKDLHSEKQA